MRDGDTFKDATCAPEGASRIGAPRRIQRPLALNPLVRSRQADTIGPTPTINQQPKDTPCTSRRTTSRSRSTLPAPTLATSPTSGSPRAPSPRSTSRWAPAPISLHSSQGSTMTRAIPPTGASWSRATLWSPTTTAMRNAARTGDFFYWPPGHSVRVETDAELVMFSPQAEHGPVLDHILAKMAAA